LGIRPSDFEKYKIPEKCLLSLTKNDIKIGETLLKEDFIKSKSKWVEELQLMLKLKKKAKIQALSSFGFQYLTEKYLPRKLLHQDWL
jgi:DNA topoisomerase VI subunit A